MSLGDGLGRIKKALKGQADVTPGPEDGRPDVADSMESLAAGFELTSVGSVRPSEQPVASLVLLGECHEVMRSQGEPHLEFGNHGTLTRVVPDGTNKPERRGYVRLEHHLELPHLYIEAAGFGALTPRHALGVGAKIASAVWALVPSEGETYDTWREPDHPVRLFRKSATLIDHSDELGFRAYLEPSGEARSVALLTPEVVQLLEWLTRSFDVEVRSGYLHAYSNYGDVVTADPEVWEWVLSATSRLFDLLRLLGAGPDVGAGWEHYTSDTVERPKKLDGAWSFLQRKK